VWNPSEHSDDENLRFCWLRAVEWGNWPTFISQPVVPIAILFWSWKIVVGAAVILNILALRRNLTKCPIGGELRVWGFPAVANTQPGSRGAAKGLHEEEIGGAEKPGASSEEPEHGSRTCVSL
jgi:hypothetical protein